MPTLVGRKRLVFGVAAAAWLTLAGCALAGNGGFAPLPPHSPNANRITDAYWVVMGFTGAIFLLVEASLVVFIFKYRRRGPRADEGDQVHGHTRLELIWTVIPVLILAAIGTVIFYELPGIKNSSRFASTHTSSTGSSRTRTVRSRSTSCTSPSTPSRTSTCTRRT
jgi:cytochrome c oxidase subunit 2